MLKKSFLRLALKARARLARRWLDKIRLSHWEIVEINYHKGELSGRPYLPSPAEKVPAKVWEKADVLIFLDLADQADPAHFEKFLASVPNKRVLFSFTEQPIKVAKLDIKTYAQEDIYRLLKSSGFQRCEIRPLPWIWGTKLVFAEKPGFQAR